MSLYPDEYNIIIKQQQLGQHGNQLSFILVYDKIVIVILETIDITLNDIVASQLRNLRPSPPFQSAHEDDTYDSILNMGQDQYDVYSIMSTIVAPELPSTLLYHRIHWDWQILLIIRHRTSILSMSENVSDGETGGMGKRLVATYNVHFGRPILYLTVRDDH
jgi:hypothetical protein